MQKHRERCLGVNSRVLDKREYKRGSDQNDWCECTYQELVSWWVLVSAFGYMIIWLKPGLRHGLPLKMLRWKTLLAQWRGRNAKEWVIGIVEKIRLFLQVLEKLNAVIKEQCVWVEFNLFLCRYNS